MLCKSDLQEVREAKRHAEQQTAEAGVEQESQEARGGEIGVALNASTRAGRKASRKGAPPACDTGSGSRVVLVNPAYPYPVSPYPVPCLTGCMERPEKGPGL